MGCFSLPSFKSYKSTRSRSSVNGVPPTRTVPVGNKIPPGQTTLPSDKFADNTVITSKYTILNFLPKNLFGQFRRIANFYFLCIAVIQLGIDSPVSPATSLSPLIFVVVVTAIKQAYEDWLRHKADNVVNKQLVRVVKNGDVQRIQSQALKVGDIVMVKSDEEFPCDLVILSSNDPEGKCHITTANLDGETNLKVHESIPETKDYNEIEKLEQLKAVIECQLPNADLYRFLGRMTITEEGVDGTTTTVVRSLGPTNLLLKGARLKNTPFIYGCAVYTGQETKMVLNLKLTSNKFSTVEKSMNRFLIVFLIFLLVETTVATALKYSLPVNRDPKMHWYLPAPPTIKARKIFEDFLAFLVLFNYIIPISLYVTLEMVKFIGAMFFSWDSELYDPESGEFAKCNTSDLNEELGQVEFLFTDKTGTLTENSMQFRQCSINGVRYVEQAGTLCQVSQKLHSQPDPIYQFDDEIERFLLALAICNTIQVNVKSSIVGRIPSFEELDYQASSPDEKALVEACKRFGVVLLESTDNNYRISFRGVVKTFKRLHVLEFDSDRKRMSVIVRDDQGQYQLFCKGAESTVLNNCHDGPIDVTLQHVNGYALAGLRTLVMAWKTLTPNEFERFNRELNNARNSMGNREELVSSVFDTVESNLSVLGATAVEDKLQEGVRETLETLRAAGIKIWVLTGDKHETAINISYSCGHIKRGMVQLNLTLMNSTQQCKAACQQLKGRIDAEPMANYALIVDGSSLAYAMGDFKELFSETSKACAAVLCCRMSPLQKAQIVAMIKRLPSEPITAAIGDGANDVSMIQEAHIGLGIMGKEGRQAVRCSDFAFAKFRFLQRVLLVHGHYYYIRVAILVQYFFYKNIAFITPQVVYAIFNAFSTQALYHSVYLMFFNIFFTSLPILVFGIMEQNIPQETLMNTPNLYKTIRRNAKLSKVQFLKWMLQGLWHAFVCYFGTYAFWGDDHSPFYNGQTLDVWCFGTSVYHFAVYLVNLKLTMHTRYLTTYFLGAIAISIISFEGFSLLYGAFIWPLQDNALYGVYFKMCSSPAVWLNLLILLVGALLPDLLAIIAENNASKIGRILRNVVWCCLRPVHNLNLPLSSSAVPSQPEIVTVFHIRTHQEQSL